jgi:hypothetical protein
MFMLRGMDVRHGRMTASACSPTALLLDMVRTKPCGWKYVADNTITQYITHHTTPVAQEAIVNVLN